MLKIDEKHRAIFEKISRSECPEKIAFQAWAFLADYLRHSDELAMWKRKITNAAVVKIENRLDSESTVPPSNPVKLGLLNGLKLHSDNFSGHG